MQNCTSQKIIRNYGQGNAGIASWLSLLYPLSCCITEYRWSIKTFCNMHCSASIVLLPLLEKYWSQNFTFVVVFVVTWYTLMTGTGFCTWYKLLTRVFYLVQDFYKFLYLVQAQSSDSPPPPAPSLFSPWPFSWLCNNRWLLLQSRQ